MNKLKFLLSYSHILLAHYLLKKISSWLIFEWTKSLEIKTFVLFDLDFANNTTLSWFFFFFLIIDRYFLIPTAIAQVFTLIAELVIPIRIPSKSRY